MSERQLRDRVRKQEPVIRENFPDSPTPTAEGGSEEIKEIKREPAKDGTMRGGPREGSGSVSGGDIPNEHQNMTALFLYEPSLERTSRINLGVPRKEIVYLLFKLRLTFCFEKIYLRFHF